MTASPNTDDLPSDLAAAHAVILAERAARMEAEARARAVTSNADVLIARLKLEIEKLRREIYGSRSERKARLLDQLENGGQILRAQETFAQAIP
jgi:transposase